MPDTKTRSQLSAEVRSAEKSATELYARDVDRLAKPLFKEFRAPDHFDMNIAVSNKIDSVTQKAVGSSEVGMALGVLSEAFKARGFIGENDFVRSIVAQARVILGADVAARLEDIAEERGVEYTGD